MCCHIRFQGMAALILATLSVLICGLEARNMSYEFPKDFMFGAATSAYQVEGAWNVDGKGVSIWDTFTHDHPDRIDGGTNGDDACLSYYYFEKDIKIAQKMGLRFYRFSLSWTRIMPQGLPNNINQRGIDYYNRVIDKVIEHGLEPMILVDSREVQGSLDYSSCMSSKGVCAIKDYLTLDRWKNLSRINIVVTIFHWDVPQYLQDLGGFSSEAIIVYFTAYARVCFENFGDRVKWWTTLNEPLTHATGYENDILAPGVNTSGVGMYLVTHTFLKCHARAYHMYDKEFRKKQQGFISLNLPVQWPTALNKSSLADVEAAETFTQFQLGWYAHPIFSEEGDYPQVMKDRIGNLSQQERFPESRLPKFTKEEVEYIKGTADYFALNHYTTIEVTSSEIGPNPSFLRDAGISFQQPGSWPKSKTSTWVAITPGGIRDIINWIKNKYGSQWKLIITENGFADNGQLKDNERIEYIGTYLVEVLKAMYIDNCSVIGYIYWALIDNFEWSNGYGSKFGLYHVDFNDPQRKRTPKQSSYVMANITSTMKIPRKFIKQEEDLQHMEDI